MRAADPIASIVVVVYGGGWEWLASALTALSRETPVPWELIVVDNGPEERVPAAFRGDFGATTVIRNQENVGFGVACNQGAACARSPVLCFLNPDVIVRSGWLPPLLRQLEHVGTGAVVPQKLNLDGTLQEAGAFVDCRAHSCVFGFGDDPHLPEHRFRREIDFGSASCLCTRKTTFEEIGGFDPIYELGYFEDADLCFRLREQGLATVYEPRSAVVHARTTAVPLEEAIRTAERNRSIFFERWKHELLGRPTCREVADDPGCAIAARDIHASEQLLVLDSVPEARALVHARARARVTLLASDLPDPVGREALLADGVEVVETRDWRAWLESHPRRWSSIVAGKSAEMSELRALTERVTRSAP